MDGVIVKLIFVLFFVCFDCLILGDFDVVLGGWVVDYVDLSSFIDLFVIGNLYNCGCWSNVEYDEVVKVVLLIDVGDE